MAIRTAAVAAIGTLAVAGTTLVSTTAAHATPETDERKAKTVVIQPGTLDRGHRPRVLHMRNNVIYDGKRRVKVDLSKRYTELVGKSRRGYIVVRQRQYNDRIWYVTGNRKRRVTQVVSGGDLHLNDPGTRVVNVWQTRGSPMSIAVTGVPGGKDIGGGNAPYPARIAAFPGPRVIVSGYKRSIWYSPKRNRRKTIVNRLIHLADPDHDRVVVRGEKGEPNFSLTSLRNPSRTYGTWQRGRPLDFSPNGKHVLTKVGRKEVQIRSTRNGHVVRTFRAPKRITSASMWESNRRVLLTVRGHKVSAVARCNLSGKCTNRATRLVKRPGQLDISWP